ncbi:MAG: MBL fold metallo-hydrolase [Hyphomonadaceae bacterium]|nr:MAG: PhnP protein [Caulobacteraceae bacterium]MBT9445118.1 MBL fold metallo-hydrolase [Hyphomonadaceae bacterium]
MSIRRVTILGCGSSGGVPRVDGDWGACDPDEPRNRRTRCSLLIEQWRTDPGAGEPTTVLIDTSPDLRQQLLNARVRRIDAIVYSHDHADQAHGIDDVRAIAYTMRRRIPTFMDPATQHSLETRFRYIFHGEGGYPPILEPQAPMSPGMAITVDGPGGAIELLPLDQDHGHIRSLGFRIGGVAYSNDTAGLPPETFAALEGLELWIVDALRRTPHPSHAHLERTLGWIETLRPGRTVLTNMHIDMDYATLRAELPTGVEPAHDGWRSDFIII